MNTDMLRQIDTAAVVLGIVLAVVMTLWRGVGSGASALAGAAIALVNFALLRILLTRLTDQARHRVADAGAGAPTGIARYGVLYLMKIAAMGGVVYLLLQFPSVDGLGLGIGFLSVSAAIFWTALRLLDNGRHSGDAAPSTVD